MDIPRKLPFHLLSFVDYKYRQRLRLVASFAVSCFRVPYSFLSSSLFVVVDVDFHTDTFLEASRSCVLEGFSQPASHRTSECFIFFIFFFLFFTCFCRGIRLVDFACDSSDLIFEISFLYRLGFSQRESNFVRF